MKRPQTHMRYERFEGFEFENCNEIRAKNGDGDAGPADYNSAWAFGYLSGAYLRLQQRYGELLAFARALEYQNTALEYAIDGELPKAEYARIYDAAEQHEATLRRGERPKLEPIDTETKQGRAVRPDKPDEVNDSRTVA